MLSVVFRPARRPNSSTCVRRAAPRPRSSRATGRSSRARRTSSPMACVATPCVSRSSARNSGGASWAVASRRSRTPVSAWLASSCRSRARRARSPSWAWSTAVAVRSRSDSRRSSMRSKARCRRATSSTLAVGIAGARVAPAEGDALHRVDELLERREAPAQEPAVDEHHRQERGDEHEEALALDERIGVQAGGDGGGEDGGSDQQRVEREDLREEGGALHGEWGVDPISAAPARADTSGKFEMDTGSSS